MKKQLITFSCEKQHDGIFSKPVLAKNNIPLWYKKLQTNMDNKIFLSDDGNSQRTVKACMPVFDMISAGYQILLPTDVLFIKNENNTMSTQWSIDNFVPISSHNQQQYETFAVPDEFYPVAFKFHNPWLIKTPPGYSSIIIHPPFRDDLPFQILPAIVDTDKHPVEINFPFFIKKDFEGILEMNMPIAQIIPFKRDSWNSTYSTHDNGETNRNWQYAKRKIMNRYKTFFRSRKEWN